MSINIVHPQQPAKKVYTLKEIAQGTVFKFPNATPIEVFMKLSDPLGSPEEVRVASLHTGKVLALSKLGQASGTEVTVLEATLTYKVIG